MSRSAAPFTGRGDPSQQLLNWGLAHSDPNAAPIDPVKSRENAEILSKVLGSQVADSERIKAAMIVIEDQTSSLDERLDAWDQLEMLVESIDNANDLKPLAMWPRIVRYLHSDQQEFIVQSLWVSGTAVQNNPSAQAAFLDTDPLPTVIALIHSTSSSADVRSKAIYALGSAVKHNEAAVDTFTSHNGFQALDFALKDPTIACRRKAAFLLDSLFQHSEHKSKLLAAARKTSVIETLVQSMTPAALPFGVNGDQTDDADLVEKATRAIFNIVDSIGPQALTKGERDTVASVLHSRSPADLGLAQSEHKALQSRLQE